MLPEQQQRILGYFIEEARDHLNTIEQGLLNLQSTLNDPEMINEVFRAAHSIKGGAAMLGLNSIQHTSHRLEDCFKILKENPIQVDQKLESLFLGVADTLKALLENLSGPYGLSEETANTLMSETEPVFQWLNEHLELLLQQGNTGVDSGISATEIRPALANNANTLTEIFMQRDFSTPEEENSQVSQEPSVTSPQETGSPIVAKETENWSEFQAQVLQTLREMLQLFKQGTTLETRQNLQQCCQQLFQLGDKFDLPKWCNLCQAATNAIANPDNSYLTLAKIVITEIKKAQELVLKGKEAEIVISQQLEVLLSFPEVELVDITSNLPEESGIQSSAIANELASITSDVISGTKNLITDLSEPINKAQDLSPILQNTTAESPLIFTPLPGHEDETLLTNQNLDPKGPEVGIAELNTLADLFEGETPELDETWQQEEILDITAANKLGIDITSSDPEDTDSDLADLLSFDEDISNDDSQKTTIQTEDFSSLFGDNFLEKENLESQQPQTAATNFDELDLDTPTDESIEEFTQILLEYPGDIAPQDVVQDLLGLALDEKENLSIAEVTQSEIAAIPNREITENEENTFHELFSESENENLIEEITSSSESQLKLPQPESFSFENLFTEIEENTPFSPDKSEIGDLFETPSTIAQDFSSSAEDLSNFWNDEAQIQQQPEFDSKLEQDVAKALEESLFTAADDFFGDTPSSTANFNLEDFDVAFPQPDEQLDLIFSPDAGDDLFADLAPTSKTISPQVDEQELPVNEINSFLEEQSDIYAGLHLPTSLSSTALPPEPLDFTPEFTNQSKAFADLEIDLFNVDTPEKTAADTEELNLVDDSSATTTPDLDFTLDNFADSEKLNLVEDSSTTGATLDLDFTLDNFDTSEASVADSGELNLFDETSATAATLDLDLNNLDNFDTAEVSVTDSKELASVEDLPATETVFQEFATLEEIADNTDAIASTELPIVNDLPARETVLPEFATLEEIADNTDAIASAALPIVDELRDTETIFREFPNLEEVADNTNTLASTELPIVDELAATETVFQEFADLEELVDNTDTLASTELPIVDELAATETVFQEFADLEELVDNTDAIASIELPIVDELAVTETVFQEFADLEELVDNTDAIASIELPIVDELAVTETVFQEFADLEELVDNTANIDFNDAAIAENKVALNSSDEAKDLSATLLNIAHAVVADPKLEQPPAVTSEDEFADLETLLEEEFSTPIPEEDFAALEALLDEENDEEIATPPPVYPQQQPQTIANNANNTVTAPEIDDEFSDLEKLLAEADHTISHSPSAKPKTGKTPRPSTRRAARFEETMKVPVKQLDDMSNLVGELVVNRNTLEQDQERLRQSLDNLLIQVQHLSDVGARMQELYERSLLEASLLASRKNKESGAASPDSNADRGFSELEMDRFTPFHTLSQEMIEMIVRVRESASDIDFVTEETERVARQFRQVTTQLQEGLTRARMVPFSQAIDRLRRGVRDNAIKYGKQVELIIEGGDTLIDKMILDHLTDPLTHMLNNAIAHGIETPEVRQATGKKPVGEIAIRAFHQGNQTVISVGDDGAGIDTERIKAKALKLGMLTPAEAKTITRPEIYDLLFQSGFSIKDQADEISGRGVGMDVVRSEISEIRGTVNTDSTLGKGTTFTIRLPLTLSICKALCCVSDKARIAFPMDGVEDTLDIPVKNIQQNADGQTFIPWRDTVLPFRPLKELLAFNRQISRGSVYGGTRDDDMVSVVVVRSANNLIALQIDLVLSEQEIVIKQFEGPAPKPLGVAGATVLGDGRIMPIADVLEIMDIFQGRISKQSGGIWQQKATPITPEVPAVKIDPTVLIVDDSITVRELLSLTFNKAGYRVEQARDGQEAWDKLRSGLPCDIVFCDIEMPRCDGLELLSRIQKDNNLNHLPIAMLTSRGADKHRQMAIQLGASGYFTKPYLEEALLEAAVRMLKGEKLIHSTTA
ncbi:hybrid sensor histidine kinase/response regulator [Calothrix sp. NIES-2098]|uniref:hybrid sensor histidine kinase/response regulator n=1 Tax=Calothrix sp. NIES-2098 TaxID=1954171 RepID=UPI000B60DC37|nr:two-component hybrid sensor and regulator [Calothrix sp. NIES-2098]